MDPKTGMPLCNKTEPSMDHQTKDSMIENKAVRPNLGAARQKCETKEEKKLRKESAKQGMRDRRQQKKSAVF